MGGPGSGRSKRPITRTRPRTRWFCHWRPRRSQPRTVNAHDAARFVCAAVKNGYTLGEIAVLAEEKCEVQDKETRNADALSVAALAEQVVAEIEMQEALLNDAYRQFLVVNGILVALAFLLRLVPNPAVRVVSLPAAAARTSVAGLITRIATNRPAANDAIFAVGEIVRRFQILGRVA